MVQHAQRRERPRGAADPGRTSGQYDRRSTHGTRLPSTAPIVAIARGATGRHRAAAVELVRASDAGVAGLAVVAAFVVTHAAAAPSGARTLLSPDVLAQALSLGDLLPLGAYMLAWQQLFVLAGAYDAHTARGFAGHPAAVVGACAAGTLLLLTFPLAGLGPSLHPAAAVALWTTTAGAALLARGIVAHVAAATPRAVRHVLIVGTGPRALRLHAELCLGPRRSHELVGFADAPAVPEAGGDAAATRTGERVSSLVHEHYLGTLDELEALLMRHVVDEVLVALPVKSRYAEIQRVIDTCARVGVPCRYPADIFHVPLAAPRFEPAGRAPFMHVPAAADDRRLLVKRALDVVGASAALVALAPLLLGIALLVRATSPGPALFLQERHGLHKRRFRMLKFRTMVCDAPDRQHELEAVNEATGPVFKLRHDPRVTPIGAFLRRTSLDELPQLVNVLLGDMSLVGPRPLPVRDVERFDAAWLMRRFSVRPGITCLWQISGRSSLTFDDWIALDLAYIDSWSLRADLSILLRTVPAVLRGTGAH